ncbi:MAG: anhydro-N-acetylmuramic acid kinase [Gammaproteobacteria bacterium RIFCSPLOWO2_02_FULL_42_14]|nr:MAG: anhydro-N-acetylmuramic acid kinase [Gammaproteobacteria bacterium RIFCSPHIGHO2_02_FULL_42_43]OGT53493.1 MAG: anhydro-N-acetylmuramic acid kinase [Gammaproteobacteria bacterium RIFCSPHIGHO2_12_FULL_41_25]OGT61439.1 MAG: anhydro-N-acetylmuramic acid kinase [Gammaproteobacteria bacterium RIFCSPLOWO2_02_FULL_42_14]OGT86497.1 MAG: anhydro-N-acetylmuramic acid kinase [Gammaproteobacteria bacterium RIFCSPLOWO2_12_FULL_42_18]
MKSKRALYIGLMSGTSMNAVDAVLVSFDQYTPMILETHSCDIPVSLKKIVTQLSESSVCDIRTFGETDTQLGMLFAETCIKLLKKTVFHANEIIAIGSHGQTIYHQPNHTHPFTLQIGDPNIIAAQTGITTVADFRRRDVALGGQGAPLVPAFHDYLFHDRTTDQFVVNIGGIANITHLSKNKSIIGFDTGPGNTLLDLWCEKNCNTVFDKNGEWARSGKLNHDLLKIFLADPYFEKKFPKSTGREYFNLNWLTEKIASLSCEASSSRDSIAGSIDPQNIQSTLTELTAKTIADAVTQLATHTHTIHLCGGGAYNNFLIERLRFHCKSSDIQFTTKIGIHPEWMEAAAFAWLAKQTLEKKPGNCPSVTGAQKESVLGAVYF